MRIRYARTVLRAGHNPVAGVGVRQKGLFAWCVLFTRVGIITQAVRCWPNDIRKFVPFHGLPFAYKPFNSN